jgi:glycosyltransferase involved in cell wall biosynthesis
MASRKPVITTRSDAILDYIDDGVDGLLVPRGDSAALRAGIERLLADAPLRDSLAAGARAAVEARYNQAAMWASIAERLHGVLAR